VEKLKEAVLEYVNSQFSDYAILITGKWGTGKTFYWKTVLSKEISNIKSIENNENYIPVYISLYGISDIQQIALKLFVEIFPLYNKKIFGCSRLNSITSLSKNLINTALNSAFRINLSQIFKNVDLNSFIKLDPKKYILCIDDLERINPKLDIESVLGFINNFVEHDYLKTIIITNESEIYRKCTSYNDIKEKLIGRTFEFKQDDKQLLIEIADFLINDKKVYNILNANIDLLHQLFVVGAEGNLRSFKFSVSLLIKIIGCYLKVYKDREVQEEFLKRIIILTLSLSFEFKHGFITKQEHLSQLDEDDQALIMREMIYSNQEENIFNGEDEDESKNNPFPIFKKINYDYFQKLNSTIIYMKSIGNYVLFGFFDEDLFEKEVSTHIDLQKEPYETVFDNIHSFRKLEQNEFNNTIEDLFSYIDSNKYSLNELAVIAYYLLYFESNKLIQIEKTEILTKIETAINNLKDICTKTSERQDFYPETKNAIFKDDYDHILALIVDARNVIKKRSLDHQIKSLLNLIDEDINEFLYQVLNSGSPYFAQPILNTFPPEEFLSKVINSSNAKIGKFNAFFEERYRHCISEKVEEKDSLIDLSKRLSDFCLKYNNSGLTSIKVTNIKNLIETLDVVIEKLKSVSIPNK
jgi:hypothetical protein